MRMPATNRWYVLTSEGLDLGVNGTPTFFINGKILVGLQPIGVFENAIEDARRQRVVEASFLASFFGGVLTLSPCSALLLPAFAYVPVAWRSRGEDGRLLHRALHHARAARDGHLRGQLARLRAQEHPHHRLGPRHNRLRCDPGSGGGFVFGPIERLRDGIKGSSLVATFSLGAATGSRASARDPSSALYSPSP